MIRYTRCTVLYCTDVMELRQRGEKKNIYQDEEGHFEPGDIHQTPNRMVGTDVFWMSLFWQHTLFDLVLYSPDIVLSLYLVTGPRVSRLRILSVHMH